MTYEFGLRERKKAKLRIDLLEALLDEMKEKSFDEIKVSDICDTVSISEVTFFKYFDRKDELLLYYMQVWNYKRELKIKKEGRKKGKQAIYRIFEDIAATRNSQRIMNTLVSYFSRLKEKPKNVTLSLCEKWLINKDLVFEQSRSIDDQLILAIGQAKKSGELPPETNIEIMHVMLATLFYGTPLISHMTEGSLAQYYKNSLDIIFKTEEKV